ncbi:hypothetical protein EAE91_04490 [Photorhabdus noenieputensis]|nr:hypothetical protein [Photorhabdus noenieputensis]
MPIFEIGIFVLIQDDGYTRDFYVCPAKLKLVILKQLYRGRNDTLITWGARLGELSVETNTCSVVVVIIPIAYSLLPVKLIYKLFMFMKRYKKLID